MDDCADGRESDEDEGEMVPGSDLFLFLVISSPFLVGFEVFGIEGRGLGNACALCWMSVGVVRVGGGLIGDAGVRARIRSE